ncbi:MAG: DUF2064 domain-containing protein [Candidatus Heimdallarchaeota archaeon]|nr:MAG: DUF2064 domain-containing protein [Candidatus Heimdallarchaeota archaeon]
MKTSKNIGIIVFTKVPISGFVKTRLHHPQLDENYITDLQTAMLKDTLLILERVPKNFVPILSFFPEEKAETLEKLIIHPLQPLYPEFFERVHIVPQRGIDVTERFSNIFSFTFNELNLNSSIIIGSDTPHLQPKLITKCIDYLQKNSKAAVLGPSQNGGFYILGHTQPYIHDIGSVFKKSSSTGELGNVMELLVSNNFEVTILPEVTDVDTFDNLKTVRAIIKLLSFTSYETKDYYFPKFTKNILDMFNDSFWLKS